MSDPLRDPDTGLLNEAYFRATLPSRVAAARRSLNPLSVVLLTLEDAEDVAPVAYALLDTLRESDTPCRLDDGRFALLLDDTPENGAVWTVERLRRLLGEQGTKTRLWAGVASYPAHALETVDLLAKAEQALEGARAWSTSRIEVAPSVW